MKHFVTKNIICIEFDDLVKLLSEANPLTTSLSLKAQEMIAPLS